MYSPRFQSVGISDAPNIISLCVSQSYFLGIISLAVETAATQPKPAFAGSRNMRANFTQLYVHCVWATWDRLPLITPDIQKVIYASIIGKCHQLGGTVIAIGGIEEHVHLLTEIPPTLSVSDLIKNIKGSSSYLINHKIKFCEFFNWQGSYRAFTVSHNDIDTVAKYVRNQAFHHRNKSVFSDWELPSG